MPIYDLYNKETDELLENHMISIAEMKKMKEEGWETLPHTVEMITTHISSLRRAGTEWQDRLKHISKSNAPEVCGQKQTINY